MKNQDGSRLLILCMALLAAGTAMGQGSGTIQGTVTDPERRGDPAAAVTARNVATGVETARQTTAAGLYVLSPLTPGEYTVSVAATGFQAFTQQHVVVDALANVGLNLQMKVGNATEQVTVEAVAATLHTEDATLGASMGNETYGALPLAMGGGVPRDPTQFIALSPGVAAVVTQSAGPSYTSFNGARAETNELYLEGIAMTSRTNKAIRAIWLWEFRSRRSSSSRSRSTARRRRSRDRDFTTMC